MIIETSNVKKISSLASGLGLLLTSSAQAGIIYTDIPDWISDLTSGPGSNSQGFDINGDLIDDFTASHSSGVSYYGGNIANLDGTGTNNPVSTSGWYSAALSAGTLIDASSPLQNDYSYASLGNSYGWGEVIGAGDTFVGLSFDVGGDIKYGWMGLNFSADGERLSIYDFAYEDSGRGIAAGDKGISVPEPSSMAMMATGALAIAAIRRRKRKQKLN